MAVNNTSPMGRLYQALRNEDLAGAQKAALDMQGKHGKTTANTKPATSPTTPAQTAAALAQASQKAQQSSLLAMLGRGTNVNTWG